MASPREAIDTLLMGSAPLTALVGSRIYCGRSSEELSYPYIRYTCISGVPDVLLDGTISNVDQRWQVDVFAASARECETIRELVNAVLKSANQPVTVTNPADGNAVIQLLASAPVTWMEPHRSEETDCWEVSTDFRMFFGRSA